MILRNPVIFILMSAFFSLPSPSRGQDSTAQPSAQPSSVIMQKSKPADFNRDIYYKNKLEFSLETGWHPINIPWPFDFLLGDQYNVTPLKYTLVPTLASLRWHMDDIRGPSILRGNWDLTMTGAITAFPRGPETHYFAYDMGIRRNFVRRSEEHTSELQSLRHLVCRLLLEKKKKNIYSSQCYVQMSGRMLYIL